jgi:hypothetical protein
LTIPLLLLLLLLLVVVVVLVLQGAQLAAPPSTNTPAPGLQVGQRADTLGR